MRQFSGIVSEISLQKQLNWSLGSTLRNRLDYRWVLAGEQIPEVPCRLLCWFSEIPIQNGDEVSIAGEWRNGLFEIYAIENVSAATPRRIIWDFRRVQLGLVTLVIALISILTDRPISMNWPKWIFLMCAVVSVALMVFDRYRAVKLLKQT